jgi:hypothetical protein
LGNPEAEFKELRSNEQSFLLKQKLEGLANPNKKEQKRFLQGLNVV